MIKLFESNIKELNCMKSYPKELFYIGNKDLLKKRKVSIVGTRRPNSYTKEFTHKLAAKLSSIDICIVSGAAMGVDGIAHKASSATNTIAVVANGLDIRYPQINKNLLIDIENNGLVISAYKKGEKARKYTFVLRNEIVVALGEMLIVSEADLNSGSLTSVNYALNMGKKVYTLAHRINESLGTQKLVKEGKCEVIYDIDEFIQKHFHTNTYSKTPLNSFLKFCSLTPSYEEAISKYPQEVFEYELEGKIRIENGKVFTN